MKKGIKAAKVVRPHNEISDCVGRQSVKYGRNKDGVACTKSVDSTSAQARWRINQHDVEAASYLIAQE
jgi:hypothetical protein